MSYGLAGAGVVLLGTATTADAATATGPSFTVAGGPAGAITLSPGESTTVTFTVLNTSSAAENITTQATGLFFDGDVPEFTGPPSPGLNIAAAPASVDLAPSASEDVRVALIVAPTGRPGGLYGGIVFKVVPPPEQGQVTVVAAQARPLIAHVPGPTSDSGMIEGFAPVGSAPTTLGPVTFQASFLDTGDIDYEVSGTVVLLSGSSTVATVPVTSRLVLPGNVRSFPVTFSGHVPAGPLLADIHLVWGVRAEHSGDARSNVDVGTVTPGVGPAPGSSPTTVSPSFISRPTQAASGPVDALHPARSRGGWFPWFLKSSALLLLVLVVMMLLSLWWRRRHVEENKEMETRLAG